MKTDVDSLTLRFDDNHELSALFGGHDRYLALIEERLDIEATPRGNLLGLKGDRQALKRARSIFTALQERLDTGHEITLSDVEGAIRMSAKTDHGKSGPLRLVTRKRTITPRSPMQEEYLRALKEKTLVFANGPAGTGKTYLAAVSAVSALERGLVDRIILSRPAVEAGEQLGFLPGDMRDKVDPYLRPLYDALYDCMSAAQVERGIESGQIEIAPLAFMRGRTLAHAYAILDEAQNCTPMQMKMFLTRLGEGSRMVVTGDPSQIDLPGGGKSGLIEATALLGNLEDTAQITFTKADVVRHPLVSAIVEAYDRADAARKTER